MGVLMETVKIQPKVYPTIFHKGFHFCFRKLEPCLSHSCNLWPLKTKRVSPMHSGFAKSILPIWNHLVKKLYKVGPV